VSGGIAEYFSIDVTLVRLGFVVLTLLTGGTALLGYLVAWVVIPEADAPRHQPPQQPAHEQNHRTPEADIAARIYDDPKSPTA